MSIVAIALTSACAPALEDGWARLETSSTDIPLLYHHRTTVLSIDGHDFGPAFRTLRVPAGYHEVHAVLVDCVLPALVVTCLHGALEAHIPFLAESGVTYVLQRGARSAWIEPADIAELRLRPEVSPDQDE